MARKRKTTARRRSGRGGSRKLNTKLMIDIAIAKLGVDVLPGLLQSIVPIPAQFVTVAGVGATWLVGSLMKKPDVQTAALALGAIEIVAPMLGGILPAGKETVMLPAPKMYPKETAPVSVADYMTLNEYVSDPFYKQPNSIYRDSY